MRRAIIAVLLISGLLILVYGYMLLNITVPVQAQDDDDREYVGVRECKGCHRDLGNRHELSRHGMTLLEVEEDDDQEDLGFLLGDFAVGEALRTVAFPDGIERAFDRRDIAFTLGAGENYQAYVTALDEDNYSVLPARWDVKAGEWVPFNLAESWPDEAYDFGSRCAGCHTVGLTFDPEDNVYEWEDEGVQCEACHGPGSLHVDLVDDAGRDISGEEYREISAALDNAIDAQVCGACHTRGIADDGIHPYPIEYAPGNELTTGYALFPPNDASHWYATGYAAQPNMQYNEWLLSGHASSLNTVLGSSAGTTGCLLCHSATYTLAQGVLIENGITDPAAFTTVPLILRLLKDTGLSPSKQQMMLERWLPLVLESLQTEDLPETPLGDVMVPLLDLLDIDEDDFDPEGELLIQFMPQLAEFIIEAEEEAVEDNDTEDLDAVNILMQQLVPFLVDDIQSQSVAVSEALGSEITSQADHFGVTCVACHVPHPAEDAEPISTYSLCVSCHQNTVLTETLHHPVQEMFEGRTIIAQVTGIPAVHFADAEGPRCVTCHMSDIPMGEQYTRINHTWNPVLPDADADTPPDACSGCHKSLSADDLRSLIVDTQDSVESRLSLAWGRVASIEIPESDTEAFEMYDQAVRVLLFIQNDGSEGVHNYAYTDALLDTAGGLLSQLSVPGSDLQPTEAPAPTATLSVGEAVTFQQVLPVTSGMRPITLIVLIGTGLLLIASAVVIFRRSASGREK